MRDTVSSALCASVFGVVGPGLEETGDSDPFEFWIRAGETVTIRTTFQAGDEFTIYTDGETRELGGVVWMRYVAESLGSRRG